MSLKAKLPWVKSPIIANAPMGGSATSPLAMAVHSAHALPFIGAGLSLSDLDTHLTTFSSSIPRLPSGLLPVGVGLLCFTSPSVEPVLPILRKHRPAIIWLFAAKSLGDYSSWAESVKREVGGEVQVWVQVGSVAAARTVVKGGNVDVLCCQGADAGGHGMVRGAGVVSLVPEVVDMLVEEGLGEEVPVVAAGGIVEGRGVAAAFALGAQGVVLGTRFLAARETGIHDVYRKAVVAAKDGAESTVRSKLFDNLRGENVWPGDYDGRSVVMESFVDFENGVEIDAIREKHNAAAQGEDAGYGIDGKGRAAMWAGTGVGLVKKEQGAAEIVEEVRQGAIEAMEKAKSRL